MGTAPDWMASLLKPVHVEFTRTSWSEMSFTSCIRQLMQCRASLLLCSNILWVFAKESAKLLALPACLTSSAPILSSNWPTSFPRALFSSSRDSFSSRKPCSRLAFAFRISSRNVSCSATMGSTSLCTSDLRSARSVARSWRHCWSSRCRLPTSSVRWCCSACNAACSSRTSAFSARRTPHVPSNGFSLSTTSVIVEGEMSKDMGGTFAMGRRPTREGGCAPRPRPGNANPGERG
mmetsp:Transcript_80246/g.249070  ORF Transcript_80246/g.249070 Transcript_80246/m.249070 type:complete len:235 (-) Transcript_80246:7-711(-)